MLLPKRSGGGWLSTLDESSLKGSHERLHPLHGGGPSGLASVIAGV